IETVKEMRILTDVSMTLELHLIRGKLHREGLLMAYLPKQKLLIHADAFAPRPGVPPFPSPSLYTVNIIESVERLKLELERIAHVQGGVASWKEVVKAAGR